MKWLIANIISNKISSCAFCHSIRSGLPWLFHSTVIICTSIFYLLKVCPVQFPEKIIHRWLHCPQPAVSLFSFWFFDRLQSNISELKKPTIITQSFIKISDLKFLLGYLLQFFLFPYKTSGTSSEETLRAGRTRTTPKGNQTSFVIMLTAPVIPKVLYNT